MRSDVIWGNKKREKRISQTMLEEQPQRIKEQGRWGVTLGGSKFKRKKGAKSL